MSSSFVLNQSELFKVKNLLSSVSQFVKQDKLKDTHLAFSCTFSECTGCSGNCEGSCSSCEGGCGGGCSGFLTKG